MDGAPAEGQADVAEWLSEFDKEFGARIQQRDEHQAAVRLHEKEALESASAAAAQAKAIASATRQLRATVTEHMKRSAAVKLAVARVHSAEQQEREDQAAKRSAAAEELAALQAEVKKSRCLDDKRCREMKAQLANERVSNDKSQKDLRATILQTKKTLFAEQQRNGTNESLRAQQKERLLAQQRDDTRQMEKQRRTIARLLQENGERKQHYEGRLKAVVSSHPNSQENLWREKLRAKSEQLAQLKRFAAAQ